jgi:hypothetical protein
MFETFEVKKTSKVSFLDEQRHELNNIPPKND